VSTEHMCQGASLYHTLVISRAPLLNCSVTQLLLERGAIHLTGMQKDESLCVNHLDVRPGHSKLSVNTNKNKSLRAHGAPVWAWSHESIIVYSPCAWARAVLTLSAHGSKLCPLLMATHG
jgi:hypothetical protein